MRTGCGYNPVMFVFRCHDVREIQIGIQASTNRAVDAQDGAAVVVSAGAAIAAHAAALLARRVRRPRRARAAALAVRAARAVHAVAFGTL